MNELDRNAGAGGSGPALAAVEGLAAGLGSVLGSLQHLGQGLLCLGTKHRCSSPQGEAERGAGGSGNLSTSGQPLFLDAFLGEENSSL